MNRNTFAHIKYDKRKMYANSSNVDDQKMDNGQLVIQRQRRTIIIDMLSEFCNRYDYYKMTEDEIIMNSLNHETFEQKVLDVLNNNDIIIEDLTNDTISMLHLACRAKLNKVGLRLIDKQSKSEIIEDPELWNLSVNFKRLGLDSENRTTLILACRSGASEIALKLLEIDTRCNEIDTHKKSALMYACEKKLVDVINCLLQIPDINLSNADSLHMTPLMYACQHINSDSMVKVIITMIDKMKSQKTSNHNQKNKQNISALLIVCQLASDEKCYENAMMVADALLTFPDIELENVGESENSIFEFACKNKLSNVVKQLLTMHEEKQRRRLEILRSHYTSF